MIIRHGQSVRHGFGEPPSIDLSHAPPAKGNSLCPSGPVRLDPRQLAVLAKGCVKARNYERIFIQRVHDGILSIDAEGRIWRHFVFHGKRPGVRIPIPERRAEVPAGKGYLRVKFPFEGRKISIFAHRLVWQFFNGDIPDELEINHRDGIKSHNHPLNLELITSSGNTTHAYRVLGTLDHKGEKHPQHVLTEAQVVQIKTEQAWGHYYGQDSHLARMFGVCSQTIRHIRKGWNWPHVGI